MEHEHPERQDVIFISEDVDARVAKEDRRVIFRGFMVGAGVEWEGGCGVGELFEFGPENGFARLWGWR